MDGNISQLGERQTVDTIDEADDTPHGPIITMDGLDYRFSRSLEVLSAPGSAQAESIGALRTHLLAQHIRDKRRSLAICGASPGVGCTFVATNLSVALAMAGVRTLLIDGNLRQPGVNELITPVADGPGLQQCLLDDGASLGEAIHADVLPNLSILYAGGIASNAQELLAGANFKGLIDSCIRDFDLTIVDTAPSNSCADARRVATVLRYAMVVVRRNASYLSDVKTLIDELHADRSTVIGTFLNEI